MSDEVQEAESLRAAVETCVAELHSRIDQARDRTKVGLAAARSGLRRASEVAEAGAGGTLAQGQADRVLAQVLYDHEQGVEAYRSEVLVSTERQAQLAREAAAHTRAIGQAGIKMARASNSSKLVAMNALISSAGLGRSGAALAVLANEMQGLSQSVHATSTSVSELARRLGELLPGIEGLVSEIQTLTDTFVGQLAEQGEQLQLGAEGLHGVLGQLRHDQETTRGDALEQARRGLLALDFGPSFEQHLCDLEAATDTLEGLTETLEAPMDQAA